MHDSKNIEKNKNSINYFTFLIVLVAGFLTATSPLLKWAGAFSSTPFLGWLSGTLIALFFPSLHDILDIIEERKNGNGLKVKKLKDRGTVIFLRHIVGFHIIVLFFTYFERFSH